MGEAVTRSKLVVKNVLFFENCGGYKYPSIIKGVRHTDAVVGRCNRKMYFFLLLVVFCFCSFCACTTVSCSSRTTQDMLRGEPNGL